MTLPRLLSLWAAAAFAAGQLNGPASAPGLPAVPALYAPAPAEWLVAGPGASPIERSLERLSSIEIDAPRLASLPQEARLKALGPVVQQLAALHVDPRAFAAEAAHDQDAALDVAVNAARHDVMQKAYELAGRANTLVWAQNGYTKEQREELYAVAAQLGEIKRYYMDFVPPQQREFIDQTELQARARFHDVQKAMVEGGALATAEALTKGAARRRDSPAAAAAPSPRRPLGSATAAALLERMKATKSGWSQKDLDTVYRGYGFIMEEGGNHRKYYHPKHPQLWTMVARHNDLAPGYAQTAVKLIAELERLEGPALPASAIAQPEEVPPLPEPGPTRALETPGQPEAVAAPELPLEPRARRSPKALKKKDSPAAAAAVATAPRSPAALAPSAPRATVAPAETPAPAAEPPKQLPVEYGWLQRLGRMLGLSKDRARP